MTNEEVKSTLTTLHQVLTGALAAEASRKPPRSSLAEQKQTATSAFGVEEDEKGLFIWWGVDGKRSKLRLDVDSTQVWDAEREGGGWFDA